MRDFIVKSVQLLFILGFIVLVAYGMSFYVFPYLQTYRMNHLDHTHKYKVINATGYSAGYTNNLSVADDGCIKTSQGKFCGSFNTKINPYFSEDSKEN